MVVAEVETPKRYLHVLVTLQPKWNWIYRGLVRISVNFCIYRYLMGRLLFHSFHLWRHLLSTAPPFILWWWKFDLLFDPLPGTSSFLGRQRWQPIQMEHSLQIRGRGRSRYYSHVYDTVPMSWNNKYCIFTYVVKRWYKSTNGEKIL
jgi:hypothetical protein